MDGEFEPYSGGLGHSNWKCKFFQYNTHILMEGSKGYESPFVSEWLERQFPHHRMMLTSEKPNSSTKILQMTLLNSTFFDHTKSCFILGGAFECNFEGGGGGKFEHTNLKKFNAHGPVGVGEGRGSCSFKLIYPLHRSLAKSSMNLLMHPSSLIILFSNIMHHVNNDKNNRLPLNRLAL